MKSVQINALRTWYYLFEIIFDSLIKILPFHRRKKKIERTDFNTIKTKIQVELNELNYDKDFLWITILFYKQNLIDNNNNNNQIDQGHFKKFNLKNKTQNFKGLKLLLVRYLSK